MSHKTILGLVVAATLAVGVAGGVCRLGVNCHLTGLPLLGRLTHHDDGFKVGLGKTSLPEGFEQDVIASGLALPTSFTVLPDGRIVIAQKDGLLRIWKQGRLLERPFLDLRRRVDSHGLRGVVAVEADPEFGRNGWVYVYYPVVPTPSSEGKNDRLLGFLPTFIRISRFDTVGDAAREESEEIILGRRGSPGCKGEDGRSDCIPLDGDHGGGDLAFSRDGTMFVSTGDGFVGLEDPRGTPLRAQDPTWLAGKILRVTRAGKGLQSNPFSDGNPESNASKVWALGFRNPFRMTIAPQSESLWVGDVGWKRFEEIDEVIPGRNYGWPCFEGDERVGFYSERSVCQSLYRNTKGLTSPRIVYPAEGIASVTGGVFLRGDELPQEYRGGYLFGDWAKGWLHVATPTQKSTLRIGDFAEDAAGPVQIEQVEDGSIYYLALNSGELRVISYRR